MDWMTVRSRTAEYIKKYRYVLLVLLAGLFLMALPGPSEDASIEEESTKAAQVDTFDLQKSLENILAQIDGAGKVSVLLTQSAGEMTLYQTDEDISTDADSSEIRRETVIVSDSGLVKQINPPVYLGAIVVCQGGNDAAVKLAVVEAVANATGLTSNKITVLKMK